MHIDNNILQIIIFMLRLNELAAQAHALSKQHNIRTQINNSNNSQLEAKRLDLQ